MKADVMVLEAPTEIDADRVKKQVYSRLQGINEAGRKLTYMSVGACAYAYDGVIDVYQGGVKLWDDAVRRGEGMEQSFNQRVNQFGRDTFKRFDRLQIRFGNNVEQVTRSVVDTSETLEDQLEKQVERVLVNLGIPTRDRLERLNQEIDRLSSKLDEELTRAGTPPA